MTFDHVRAYCLALPAASEHMPWDDDTLVFKVKDKVFAITNIYTRPTTINLKCDPERAVDLRARYHAIAPGYHMNKKHWNTLTLDGSLPDELIRQLIDHSWDLVVGGLKRPEREELLKMKSSEAGA